jgi:hypothetical protein
MWIEFTGGVMREGMILSLLGSSMRVAVVGNEDVSEFRLVRGRWISDDCEVVSFRFPPGTSAHDQFRQVVEEALRPIERLPGTPDWKGWTAKAPIQ